MLGASNSPMPVGAPRLPAGFPRCPRHRGSPRTPGAPTIRCGSTSYSTLEEPGEMKGFASPATLLGDVALLLCSWCWRRWWYRRAPSAEWQRRMVLWRLALLARWESLKVSLFAGVEYRLLAAPLCVPTSLIRSDFEGLPRSSDCAPGHNSRRHFKGSGSGPAPSNFEHFDVGFVQGVVVAVVVAVAKKAAGSSNICFSAGCCSCGRRQVCLLRGSGTAKVPDRCRSCSRG
mmetsp:Transcript_32730/g.70185  ORF Transcript_32730/g.70185 Transcript_32730/m.70185 type:complete len:231 (-) Transcript_32730:250-942(-)